MAHDTHLSTAQARQARIFRRVMNDLYTMSADSSGPFSGSLHRALDLLHRGVPPGPVARQLIQGQAALTADARLPAAVGADLSPHLPLSDRARGHLYLQLQTVTAVARIYGFDLALPPVRSLCFFCLCQDMSVRDVLRMAGLDPGTQAATALVRHASDPLLHFMDRYLVRRLLVGFAYQDQLDRPHTRVPGARTGGTFDGATTHAAGQKAQQVFQADSAPPPRRRADSACVAVLNDRVYHA